MPVTVYVLKSRDRGRRYVGITNDLPRRVREHARGRLTADKRTRGPIVVYTEEHPDYSTARARERFLKSGRGRKWLDRTHGPRWPARGG